MKRLSLPLVLAVMAALLWQSVTPAQACYYETDFHPVARSELILLGTISRWEVDEGDNGASGSRVPIKIYIDVELVFKGPALTAIEVSDAYAVELVDGRYSWDFGIADCGLFASAQAPPVGDRVLIGLERSDGSWTEVFTFYSRDSAIHGGWAWSSDYDRMVAAINDPDYRWGLMGVRPEAIERIPRNEREVNQAPVDPAKLSPDAPVERAEDVPALPVAVAAVAIPLAFVLAASFVFPAKASRA